MSLVRRVLDRYLAAGQGADVATGLPVPAVHQTPGMCGPASLKAVLAYYGVRKTEDELARLAGAGSEGTPPESLVHAARALGFRAGYKDDADLDDVRGWLDRKVPVIVDWFSSDEGHYSVVTAIRDGSVYMKDPEIGTERAMPLDSFERVWFDFDTSTEQHRGLVSRRIIVVSPRS